MRAATLVKILYVTVCIENIRADEDPTEYFIEHILKDVNTDSILNSVLGRLERSREQRLSAGDEEWIDTGETLPEYTESLQGTRATVVRQIGTQKHYPICHIERKIKRLNTEEYEYRPSYIEEITCTSRHGNNGQAGEICTSLGFSCVQWNKTLHLTRRRYTSDCWKSKTMVVPAGCECMWPMHLLGDIRQHTST